MISIVIPACNEAVHIKKLIDYLQLHSKGNPLEIIVADGGSQDETVQLATQAGAIAITSPQKGRAVQMNFGASLARGDILYFVHADTYPPTSFVSDIEIAIAKGYHFGRYQTRFDSPHPFLKFNAFFTRFDWTICYGGDQTLFVTRKLFETAGGFDPAMQIMEDYDLVARLKKMGRYKIFSKCSLVSARKYETNSWLKVQVANKTIVRMYQKGASQQEMVDRYKQMLVYR